MHKVKYIQFKLSNMLRAWVSRKVCRHIMPDYEPMGIYVSGTRVAINGKLCINTACRVSYRDEGEWKMTQCLESYRCMNSGIKVWTNSNTGAVVIQNISHHNMRV